jgi:hypothetical protein
VELPVIERLKNKSEITTWPHNFALWTRRIKQDNAIRSSPFSTLTELHHTVNPDVVGDETTWDELVGANCGEVQ